MKPIPPCYDSVNKQDCPDRRPGCHSKCKKWRQYERNRDRDYHERLIDVDMYDTEGTHKRYVDEIRHSKNRWDKTRFR